MLVYVRNLLYMNLRLPNKRVSSLLSMVNYLSFILASPSSSTIIVSSPAFICFTSFLYITKYSFGSKSSPQCFFDGITKDYLRNIIHQNHWDDPKMVALFSSALSPIWVSKVLVELKEEPKEALEFFKWAKSRTGFSHTTESYTILVHILFHARLYFDATSILKELILSRSVFLGFDVFDMLWSTRNVCVYGFGVFDALFSVLVELGMLEEANQCFMKMKRFRVLPKTRSCNALLHRLCKFGKGDLLMKFFNDMVETGIGPSIFTYNIMIDYLCKEGDIGTARLKFLQMKQMGITPDIVTYNSLIDGYGKAGFLNESVCILEEMKKAGCQPDIITYNALINCFCKFERMPQAFEFLHEMKVRGLKPNVVTYSTLIDALCKVGMLQVAIKLFVDMRKSWSFS
ncbi:PPR domain-containing protein/PPR_1 domain-containing protein/PPR_2 domain-containing protein [Cephalotus follicularis]|uniref:PPR domain-containing protein/PPR_1 domain-containing protein/PPR_2 domain-containing protein n=1 Tax=Cephalotus follicularis TaxID=3775 RepID=A0A1Q3BZT1_CEPFO|nr:PPR domain-containing protein/PPR_1 domain-containing protein/PPR_2 domain-containing protein [Cephalotus follicularis]